MNIEHLQLEFTGYCVLGTAFSGLLNFPKEIADAQSSSNPNLLLSWLAFGL